MTPKRPKRDPDQLRLEVGSGRLRRGRVRRGVDDQIRALRQADRLDAAEHAGPVTLARTVADSVDRALATDQPYAVAHLAARLLEVLAVLVGRPYGAGADRDALAQLALDLSAPVSDGPQ